MIGFEKEKQMLGCSDDSKCMTEIAGALGADWILVGSLGQLDALYRLDLKLIDAKRSKISGRIGDSIEGSQARLVAATQAGVHKLLDPIAKAAAAAAAAAPVVAKPKPAPVVVSQAASPPAKQAAEPAARPVAEPVVEPDTESASAGGAGLLSHLLVAVRLTGLGTGGDAWGTNAGTGQGSAGMTELVKSGGAVALDAAWKLGKGFAAGLYVEGGRGGGGACREMGSCSVSLSRFGLQALWEEQPGGRFRWWGSFGAGYEWLDFDSDVLKATIKGPELANLKGGADFRIGSRFTVGPYLTISAGQYRTLKGTVFPPPAAVMSPFPIEVALSRKVHTWYGLGVRGTWGL
jgi:hypothetical protein